MPEPGIAVEALPPLSLIALTHAHEDHFDRAAFSRLPSRAVCVVTPSRHIARQVRALGFTDVHVLGFWETMRTDGWSLTAVPARAPNALVEASWFLEVGGARILHAGDTAMHPHFEEIRERCDPVVGLLPVNGVSMLGLRLTMTPEQAARAAFVLRLRLAIPIHAEMFFGKLSRLLYRASGSPEKFEASARRLAPRTRVILAERGIPIILPAGQPTPSFSP